MKKAKDNLYNIQYSVVIQGNSDNVQLQEKEAQLKLDVVLNIEEAFWREMAKIN